MSRLIIGFKQFVCFLAVSLLLGVFIAGCTQAADKETPQLVESAPGSILAEDSRKEAEVPTDIKMMVEGSGGNAGYHPDVQESEKLERRIRVPKGVEGKWRAVKILVKNKTDEARNELKTVTIGSSFMVRDSGIKVTVGPFLPNFVMDRGTYTSMNNQATNPAVQLVVEENGKVLYKGWTFAKYPAMYAFEHEVYALELEDHIPADVS